MKETCYLFKVLKVTCIGLQNAMGEDASYTAYLSTKQTYHRFYITTSRSCSKSSFICFLKYFLYLWCSTHCITKVF